MGPTRPGRTWRSGDLLQGQGLKEVAEGGCVALCLACLDRTRTSEMVVHRCARLAGPSSPSFHHVIR